MSEEGPNSRSKQNDRLTTKSYRFCEEYIKDQNGTAAVKRAGYKTRFPAEIATQLLKKQCVIDEIAKMKSGLHFASKINPVWVLNKLQTIVERSLQEVPVIDKNGKKTGYWKFDGKSANAALQTIARHLGMLNDKLTVQGHVTVDQMSEEERAQRIAELLNRVKERLAEQGEIIDGTAIPQLTQDSSAERQGRDTQDDGSQQ